MQSKYEAVMEASGLEPEITEVLHGSELITPVLVSFVSKTKKELKICVDQTWPSVAIEVSEFNKVLHDAKDKGVKTKVITEIIDSNIDYCKRLLEFCDLRHMDGVRGNFGVNEKEYVATANLKRAQPVQQLIYSNVREIIEQQQYVFDTLWFRSLPAAEIKIKEIQQNAKDLRKVIDTFHICTKCAASFVFVDDVEEHKIRTGHQEFFKHRFADELV